MNQQDKSQNPLGTQSISSLLVKYCVPSIIAMVVMSLYNIVDQIFIGHSDAGYLGNGATTVAFPLVTIMLGIALLIGNGSAAYISLQMGKGNNSAARKTIGNALLVLVVGGALMAAVVLLFLEPVLKGLGATADNMQYAKEYAAVIMLGAPFSMITSGLTAVIRSDGSPRYSMVASCSGAVLNTILDPIFIFPWGLNMGVQGAAVATVISQIVSALLVVYYLARKARHARLVREGFKLDISLLKIVAAYGSSSFVTQVANTVVNVVMNNSLRHYGAMTVYGSDICISSVGIVMKINAILLSIILGVSIGAQPILGYNYGAGNYHRVKRTYTTTICITAVIAGIFNLLFLLIPEVFIRLFGDESPLFNEFGAMALSTFLMCVTATGLQIPSANYFQAVGKPVKAMTLTMTRQLFLLVPAILILPLFFGLKGALYAGPFADVTALLITGFFIVKEMRHLAEPPAVADAAKPVQGEC